MGIFSKLFLIAWAIVGILLLCIIIIGLWEFLITGALTDRLKACLGLCGWAGATFFGFGVIRELEINLKY